MGAGVRDSAPELALLLLLLPAMAGAQGSESVVFREVRPDSVDFVNTSGEPDKRYIVSTLASGVALIDYDTDGDLDLYFVNGAALVEGRLEEVASDRLYRNEGGWSFVDVTEKAGLGDTGWGVGAAVGDIDNDGDPDLYVTRFGRNHLYLNGGDGTFTEAGQRAGVAEPGWSTSAAFFDADGDGDLDLYVAKYIDIDFEAIPPPGKEPRCQWFGVDIMCGPNGLPGLRDVFFLNQGNGTFSDETEAAGLSDPTGSYGLGVVTGDFDDDGDVDLYVANDSVPNFLYRNDGAGGFTETAFLSGVALSSDGLEQAGMGVDAGDLDGDGRLDLFVTNFSHEPNNAYFNHGAGLFVDGAGEASMHASSWFALGWGTRMVDFDHDGDLDIFVSNGHVYPGVDQSNLNTRYHQANQIFWNDGAGTFTERDLHPSDGLGLVASSRSVAFGDLDEDGDVDGVVINIDAAPYFLDNRLGGSADWIRFLAIGRESSRDAIGARITVVAEGVRQVRELHPCGSFLSSSDPRVHFGVPGATQIQDVRVRWPSGREEQLGPMKPGYEVILLEGFGALSIP